MKKIKKKGKELLKNTSDPRGPNSWRSFMFFILITGLALFFAGFFNQGPAKRPVSYSELKASIREGKVQKVFIGTESVEAIPHDKSAKVLLAKKVEDPKFVEMLEEKGVAYEARNDYNWLSDFFFTWILPLLFVFFIWQFFMGRAFRQGGGPPGLLTFGKSRAKLVVDDKDKRVTFAEVAGCDEAKEELQEIISFLKNPEKYKNIGGRIPKGVLLVGPPGTGKTLLARATAGEAGVHFFQISGSDFVEMFVGVGAARVRDLFREASKKSPCIIFIDELDAVAKSRGQNVFQSNDERENTLNQILVEMDGFENYSGVVIMAATNRPEVLDPAILRPGRFDRQVTVDRPDIQGREAILKVHARKVKMDKDIDYHEIAARTPMFTGADLANVINEAALLAVRKGFEVVKKQNIDDAIDRVIAGLAKKNKIMPPDEKRTVAIHEVGHALVAHFSEGADPVHRISIIPRSSGALGFTMQIPEEERHLMTEHKLRSTIRILLGGRAAEKVINGEVTTGAYDDLRRASSIIRKMIMEFGMSDSLGLVSLGEHNEAYAGNPFVQSQYAHVSERTAESMDVESRKILDQEFSRACDIVRDKRELLESMVTMLLDKETIEYDELKVILPPKPQRAPLVTA
jgi:cell division protease FtsH